MHHNFADWYQPVTFGHDRETIELRWQGVEKVIDDVDYRMVTELTRLVFGYPAESEEFLDRFRVYFKEIDQTFKSTGNDQEVMVLAGCVLAVLCDEYDKPEAPLSILTTLACGTRVPKVEIDLVNMANEWLQMDGINTRKRPKSSDLIKIPNKKDVDEAIKIFNDSPDPPNAVEALKILGPCISQLIAQQNKAVLALGRMQSTLNVQDEELQMLWWMVSGWSTRWNSSFDDIEIKARPIMLAKEAACMTDEASEPPSVKAVFSRVGIDGSAELTIPESINACGVDNLKALEPKSAPCSTIFPLHFAISRALETDAKSAWIAAWSKMSGINKKAQVTSLDLAVQMFREHKLMMLAEANNE